MRRLLVLLSTTALVAASLLLPSTTATAGTELDLPQACVDPVQEPTNTFMSANVKLKCHLPIPAAIGARFREYGDDTYMFVTFTGGLAVYDVTDPNAPTLTTSLPLPHFENEDVDFGGDLLMISNDAAESTGILYLIDISNPASPQLVYSPTPLGGIAGVGGPGHTASCINNCDFAWITNGGAMDVWDLRPAQNEEGVPVKMGTMNTDAGGTVATHDVQKDGNGLYWVAGFGGTYAYKVPSSDNYDNVNDAQLVAKTDEDGVSTYLQEAGLGEGLNPNDYIHHNSARPKDSGVIYITEEDYTRPGCRGAGSFQTWKVALKSNGMPKDNAQAKFADQWMPELLADAANAAGVCSAHYFDVSKKLVAQGWYEMGTRFLDVSDPNNIKQVGFWIPPRTMTWSSYFVPTDKTKSTVYSLDALRGIDVLKIDRSSKGKKTAPMRKSWRFEPDVQNTNGFRKANDYWGWACRISVPPVLPEL